jgi:hypothetical protein
MGDNAPFPPVARNVGMIDDQQGLGSPKKIPVSFFDGAGDHLRREKQGVTESEGQLTVVEKLKIGITPPQFISFGGLRKPCFFT